MAQLTSSEKEVPTKRIKRLKNMMNLRERKLRSSMPKLKRNKSSQQEKKMQLR